ncbi:CII family transcriptional regulator [Actinobacillus seminis]
MTALEIESEILKQIELNDLDNIGEIVGVCGSAISKWKGDQKITKFSRLLLG